MMEAVRRCIPLSDDIHLQFASSPGFLAGRTLFRAPRLVLLDVNKDTSPLRSALQEFTSAFPDVRVIALADKADRRLAVDMTRLGAFAYLSFPREHRQLTDHISSVRNEWLARTKKEHFVELQQEVYDFRNIVGDSSALKVTIERAHKIIKNTAMTVLITGETGTGKELFAKAIHYNSANRNSPFVDIACSALPETLLESELFGYEKGAFTDAKERKIGLFELAGEGTIFLDEIGDISMAMQSKLLKVIEDRTMRRVGGIRDIPVRARVIAATSADLEAKLRSGEFRRDLYHRLKILPLELPPLRKRREDIPLLAQHFLDVFAGVYQKRLRGVTPQALQVLMDQDWEGNVRELKHCLERAVLLEEGEWITEHGFEFRDRKETDPRRTMVPNSEASLPPKELSTFMFLVPVTQASVNEVQRMLALKVLEYAGGNKARAAKILKVSRPRLDRILHDGDRDDDD